MNIKSRLEKLERGSVLGQDLARAEAIFAAQERMWEDRVTADDLVLLAMNCWQRALCVLIDASGGLAAVLMEIETARLSVDGGNLLNG